MSTPVVDASRVPIVAAAPRRLSALLRQLSAGDGGRISLDDLVLGMRDRSVAPLMVLCALPNLFLYLPGASLFTGLPLVLLAAQLLAGRSGVWLPPALGRRSLDGATFARLLGHALPWIERVERLARPRLWTGDARTADRVVGLACLVMAVLLFLPIPFANGLPALAIMALAVALTERDGLWLGAGLVLCGLSGSLVAAILGGGAMALTGVVG